MDEKINVKGLIPDFGALFSFQDSSNIPFPPQNAEEFNELIIAVKDVTINLDTPEQLSAFFVAILIILFCSFLLLSIVHSRLSKRRIKWVLKLIKKEKTSSIASVSEH